MSKHPLDKSHSNGDTQEKRHCVCSEQKESDSNDKQITKEEYIRAVDYPNVLGNLIEQYSQGICDINTQEGRKCWSIHQGCDRYALDHLDAWLVPIIQDWLTNYSGWNSNNIVPEIQSINNKGQEKTITFPPPRTETDRIDFSFVNHPVLENIYLDVRGKFSIRLLETVDHNVVLKFMKEIFHMSKDTPIENFIYHLGNSSFLIIKILHLDMSVQFMDEGEYEIDLRALLLGRLRVPSELARAIVNIIQTAVRYGLKFDQSVTVSINIIIEKMLTGYAIEKWISETFNYQRKQFDWRNSLKYIQERYLFGLPPIMEPGQVKFNIIKLEDARSLYTIGVCSNCTIVL